MWHQYPFHGQTVLRDDVEDETSDGVISAYDVFDLERLALCTLSGGK